GTGQEVDWLRWKEGKFQSLLEKSTLLGEETPNAPGIDGVTINRFTGDKLSGVTIKANESTANIGTNVDKVLEALKKGTLEPSDTLVGVEGTGESLNRKLAHALEKAMDSGDHVYADKLRIAQEQLKVQELNNTKLVKQSTERLKDKMAVG